jgi:RimJ/RimL family protein N-acetyltransferase
MNEWFHQFSLEDVDLLANNTELFLQKHDYECAPEALLPPEFIAQFVLPTAHLQSAWLGFAVLRDQIVVGSGYYRNHPVDGMIEIGYGIAPSFQRQGCATRLTHCLVNYAEQSPEVRTVRAHTLPDGIASQTVLLKNDFKFAGIFEDPEDGTVHRYERLK